MDRKGGGARRGPFVGKREPFATRLTSETMERLAKAAENDGLSISQKAEELIILGLRVQDTYERVFGPALVAFEQTVQQAMAARGGRGPDEDPAVLDAARSAMTALAGSLPNEARQPEEAKPATSVPPKRRGRQIIVEG